MISLKGKDKAVVLAKLYNASKPLCLGTFHYEPQEMTVEEAMALLDSGQTYFDYLNGRLMKIDLSGDTLNPALYDRDNGPNAAINAIEN